MDEAEFRELCEAARQRILDDDRRRTPEQDAQNAAGLQDLFDQMVAYTPPENEQVEDWSGILG